MHSGYPIKCMI